APAAPSPGTPSGNVPPGHPPVGTAPTGGTAGAADPANPTAGGLGWKAPAVFTWKVPESRMRAAEYTVSAGAGEPASLAVFYFGPGQGGDAKSNIDRWAGQFKDDAGNPAKAKTQTSKVNGMASTVVDVSGTYASGMPAMGPHGGGDTGPKVNQRMLGAIVEGPNGPVFFKFVGPKAAVDSAESGFHELVESVHPL
ncbi:MAG: hypothetical protein KC417_10975, partial [Myxococcales bacterium]|nr:hypothetical protein [Myxococcales bacterium]